MGVMFKDLQISPGFKAYHIFHIIHALHCQKLYSHLFDHQLDDIYCSEVNHPSAIVPFRTLTNIFPSWPKRKRSKRFEKKNAGEAMYLKLYQQFDNS